MPRGRKRGTKIVDGKAVYDAINKELPTAVQLTTVALGEGLRIDKEAKVGLEAVRELPKKSVDKPSNDVLLWDVPIGEEIKFFDANLSYELTKYRPINETEGLDFNPAWFTEARDLKVKTGYYTKYRPGTKAHRDFWAEQFRRCREGYECNGYRITGDNYFFLNFYRLRNITDVKVAGEGRQMDFPQFFSKQYEYFHYIDLCNHTKHDICALKARGVG